MTAHNRAPSQDLVNGTATVAGRPGGLAVVGAYAHAQLSVGELEFLAVLEA